MKLHDRVEKVLAFCKKHNLTVRQVLRIANISEYDFICFLDNDIDYITSSKLDRLYQLFEFDSKEK